MRFYGISASETDKKLGKRRTVIAEFKKSQ